MKQTIIRLSQIAAYAAALFLGNLPAVAGTTTFAYSGIEGGGFNTQSVQPSCCLWVEGADGNIGVGVLAAYPGKSVTGTISFDSANWTLSAQTANSATYTYTGVTDSTETWSNGSDPWTFDFAGYRSAQMVLTNRPQGSTADTADLTLVGRQAGSGYYYYSKTYLTLVLSSLGTLDVTNTSLSGLSLDSYRVYHDFLDSPSNRYGEYQVNPSNSNLPGATISVEGSAAPEPASALTAFAGISLCGAYLRRRSQVSGN